MKPISNKANEDRKIFDDVSNDCSDLEFQNRQKMKEILENPLFGQIQESESGFC